ncbi:AfsR/SARP family transcriptional regulator [Streptomyces sp. DH8]|uniref:AfsR/SARP family transcriptional regulator n=1 Tax=Streptomyces sp. DH8 TaxID=2857008 RepID=UPI001E3A6998|nr:AfsR/SARP family transcriptional regulator [Streptomyces sp. DH8]
MRFSLLGSFEITTGSGTPCTLRSPKVRQVLALLLARANEVVPVDALIQELWGDSPPRSALTTLQTYVYHARKAFAQEGLTTPTRPLLVTCPPGYRMEVESGELDVALFEERIREARNKLREGDDETALRLLSDALGMWRGRVLADILAGDVLTSHIAYLEELRLRTIELRIETSIRLGHRRELVAELRSLVKDHPLNEWFHGQLISILSLSGRRGEALEAYRNLRQLLNDELGLDPSAELQRLHQEVLNPSQGGRSPFMFRGLVAVG